MILLLKPVKGPLSMNSRKKPEAVAFIITEYQNFPS